MAGKGYNRNTWGLIDRFSYKTDVFLRGRGWEIVKGWVKLVTLTVVGMAAAVAVITFVVPFLADQIETYNQSRNTNQPFPVVSASAPEIQITPPGTQVAPRTQVTAKAPATTGSSAISPQKNTESVPSDAISEKTIHDTVLNTTNWVRIDILWANGRKTVFERDRDSSVWTMQSRDGNYRMVEPDFSYQNGTLSFGFPTTANRYYLNSDGTGMFAKETLTWEFETDISYSKMSDSGVNQTHDLGSALSRYMLLVIRVYWNNGELTIFYKQGDGSWMMRGRNGSFSSVEPSFSSGSNLVFMGFPTTTKLYSFNENGTGAFGDEGFSWFYNFSSE